MGKVITPKYRLIIDGNAQVWRKEYGKPNDANLEKYVIAYGKSLETGGCNAHISKACGFIPYPVSARIESNLIPNWESQVPLATWKAAAFQIW